MTNLPEGTDPRELRASDHDRDRVAEVLREAAGDGRLTLEELDERLGAVYAAKTYGELEPITRDLPIGAAVPSPPAAVDRAPSERFGGVPTSSFAVGILGGFSREGAWVAPREFTAVAFWGGGEIDLREAKFADHVVTIRAFAVMGGINVIVPEDAHVEVQGIGVMGGFGDSASGQGSPGAPRIVIKGFTFWGGVGTERKLTRAEARRRKLERRQLKREGKQLERDRKVLDQEQRRQRLEPGGEADSPKS